MLERCIQSCRSPDLRRDDSPFPADLPFLLERCPSLPAAGTTSRGRIVLELLCIVFSWFSLLFLSEFDKILTIHKDMDHVLQYRNLQIWLNFLHIINRYELMRRMSDFFSSN